jgi:hypothetical protein
MCPVHTKQMVVRWRDGGALEECELHPHTIGIIDNYGNQEKRPTPSATPSPYYIEKGN